MKAGVAWYGRLVGQASELTPKHPVDIAPSLEVPVLGLYGGADQGIPPQSIEQMRVALERGASVFRVHDVRPTRDALVVAAATLTLPWPTTPTTTTAT